MKTAYENWLIKAATDLDENISSHRNTIAQFIYMDCQNKNVQAFNLMGDMEFIPENFLKAADLILLKK